MSLYKTTKGTWGVDWRDEHGRRHRREAGDEATARALEATLHQTTAQAKHTLRHVTPLSLAEALTLFHQNQPTAKSTQLQERLQIQLIARQLPNDQIQQLSSRDLLDWAQKQRELYGPNTQRTKFGILKRLFAWLEEAGLAHNIASSLRPPRPALGRSHIISYAEETAILAATRQSRLLLRVLLGLDAGLSIADAASLRRSHCDLEHKLIAHTRHKTLAQVLIPMTARLHQAISQAATGLGPQARLTSTREIKRPTDFIEQLRLRSGVPFTFHDLRRTFATRLAATTTNPIVITALLGHRIPWAVQLAYVKPSEELLRQAIAEMEAANPNCQPQHLPDPGKAPTPGCWHCHGTGKCPCHIYCIVCRAESIGTNWQPETVDFHGGQNPVDFHVANPRIEIGWREERLKGRSPSRDVCYRDFGRNL